MTYAHVVRATAPFHRSISAGLGLLLVGVLAAGPPRPASANEAVAAAILSPQAATIRPDQLDPGSFHFAIGDRLKITFFEQYQSEAEIGADGILSALVERSEMTGEHVVQQDGSIFLPLLGTIAVAGQTRAGFDSAMRTEFGKRFDGEVKINVEILEREPIYVTGAIPQPGAFKHVPGMTILHAMVLAGSFKPGDANRWQQIDLMRERERLTKAEERLKNLLARADVLVAARADRPAQPSRKLIELAGASRAGELVEEALRLHQLEVDRVASQSDGYDAMINAIDRERSILQQSVTDAEVRMKDQAERVAAMNLLRERGVVTEYNFQQARTEANSALERWNDARAAIAGIERSLHQVYQEKSKIALDQTIDLEKELKDARLAILEEEATRATVGSFLKGMGTAVSSQGEDEQGVEFQIVRRSPSGMQILPADQLTGIEPGDVVRVIPVPSPLQSAFTQ